MQATAVEHLHRRLETLACFAADDVDGGNPHVVEIDVASARAFLSHLLVGLTEGQTRQTGRDDEGGNATRPRAAGACHQREGTCARRIGDKALRTTDHVVAAISHGLGL